MDGILNVDKPPGSTSFQVVSLIRKLSGEKRVGHAGTLDPMATGVLPVCVGKATRVIEFFSEMKKRYMAEVLLGIETDTYDTTGEAVRRADASGIGRDRLEAALEAFRGTIQQTPPMYSAVKHQGKPLYKLARQGIAVERKPRAAEIYSLELVEWRPPVARLDILCGKGTYIRCIAHDLGQSLGCGAAMSSLVRTQYGCFTVGEAVSTDALREAFRSGTLADLLHSSDSILSHLPAAVLSSEAETHMKMGRTLAASEVAVENADALPDGRCRAYALDGRFIGMLRFNAGKRDWQPDKVLLNF